jgi:hypothetical protein
LAPSPPPLVAVILKVGKIYFCEVFAERKYKNQSLGEVYKKIQKRCSHKNTFLFHVSQATTLLSALSSCCCSKKNPPLLIYKLAIFHMTEAVDILADTRLEYWNIGIYCRNVNI